MNTGQQHAQMLNMQDMQKCKQEKKQFTTTLQVVMPSTDVHNFHINSSSAEFQQVFDASVNSATE